MCDINIICTENKLINVLSKNFSCSLLNWKRRCSTIFSGSHHLCLYQKFSKDFKIHRKIPVPGIFLINLQVKVCNFINRHSITCIFLSTLQIFAAAFENSREKKAHTVHSVYSSSYKAASFLMFLSPMLNTYFTQYFPVALLKIKKIKRAR